MARRRDKHLQGFNKKTVSRAAFQPDSPPALENNQPVWQHQSWQVGDSWQVQQAQAHHQAEDPWEADFSASNPEWVWDTLEQEPVYQEPVCPEPAYYPQPAHLYDAPRPPVKTKRFRSSAWA